MRYKKPALVALAMCVILFGVACYLAARTWGGGESAAQPAADGAAGTEQTAGLEAPPMEEAPIMAEPTVMPKPTVTPEPTATPWPGPLVPEQSTPVGADYFADAAFLGNSVLSGLWYYDYEGLFPKGTEHWYWHDSLTIMGASPYAAQMSGRQFGKIYIEFGINEVNYDKGTLEDAFDLVINQLKNDHPEAIIYLISVTPVSKYCDENRSFKRNAVLEFNEMLQQIAREKQVWYLDVYPVLCGEDGYLPSNVTPDGVHFTPAHYELWLDYMKTHYVPTAQTADAAVTPEAPPAADGQGSTEQTQTGQT